MPYLETRIRDLFYQVREEKGEGEAVNRYNTTELCPPSGAELRSLDNGPEAYKYQFRQPPRQNDPVIRHIIRLIRSLNVEHIEVANMSFRVSPTDSSQPFWLALPDYTTYCSKLYTFMDDFNEFPLTAWVTYSPAMNGSTADNLHLRIGTKWILLKEWLLSSPTETANKLFADGPDKVLLGKMGYRAQRKWWARNKKHFRLADLPTELRMKIYEFAIGPRIYPLSTGHRNGSVRLGLGFRAWHDRRDKGYQSPPSWYFDTQYEEHTVTGCSAYEPNIALLCVSKKVCAEALQAGWENTRKCFLSPVHLEVVVMQSEFWPDYNWLNHVILDFTMAGWFKFFGIEIGGGGSGSGVGGGVPFYFSKNMDTCQGGLLGTLEHLASLQLWFRSPDDGDTFYPRGLLTRDNGRAESVCCQRTMVDWIMTFAWPFVSELPKAKVTVGGILKRYSREKWNEMLAMSVEDKRRVFDHRAEEEKVLNTPESLL
jgi:hypothetical protein